jgi:cob(I)alamin adenosyltransferase
MSRAFLFCYTYPMLYTRKGDNGTTKTFGCDQRISKSSAIAEALGTLDEINSLLGVCKVKSAETAFVVASGRTFADVVGEVQHNLFIVQAELAGADKHITEDKVKNLENLVDGIESELPPIKTFFVSGGSELAATFDFARTLARRAERRVVQVNEEGGVTLGAFTLPYLNRLSSLLYALARLSNRKSGVVEESPNYQ